MHRAAPYLAAAEIEVPKVLAVGRQRRHRFVTYPEPEEGANIAATTKHCIVL